MIWTFEMIFWLSVAGISLLLLIYFILKGRREKKEMGKI